MDIENILNNHPVIWSAAAFVGGGIVASIIAIFKNRIRRLEYTVNHERVGLSATDNIFGNVNITWQGTAVQNLFLSTVTLQNNTARDYNNLEIKAYTGDTKLLNHYTEITGTTYNLNYTDAYQNSLDVPNGQQPTTAQLNKYVHSREFLIPVLNRGERIIIRFLNTVPTTPANPSIWLDTLTPGLKIKYRPNMPEIHGVQVRIAMPLGLLACLGIFLFSVTMIEFPLIVGGICMLAGFIAQSIGAAIFKLSLQIRRLFDY